CAYLGFVKALLIGDAIGSIAVGNDLADAKVIILEHLEAALSLHAVMLTMRAPADHGLLVTPYRQRQHLAIHVEAPEALIGDEPIDGFEFRFQLLGERQVVVPALSFGLHFENDGKHGFVPPIARTARWRLPTRSGSGG